MYNFAVGNNQTKTEKWLNPKSKEQDKEDENNDYRSFSSRNNPIKPITGTSSGPVKILNNQQTFNTGSKPTSTVQTNQKANNNSNNSNSNNNSGGLTRSKVFDLNIMPKRLALSYIVPTIKYLVPKTGKLYHHKIKIRELRFDSDEEKVLNQIKRRHEMYLTKIPDKQILNLIVNLQKNLKRQNEANLDKEPEKPQDISNRKEKDSGKKSPTIIDPFKKQKVIADRQISFEEKELCEKLKNQFGDDDDFDDYENEYIEQSKKNKGQKNQQSKNKQEEDDDFDEYEENQYQQGNDQEYDYDFDEYSESDASNNNVQSKENNNDNRKITQQQISNIQKEMMNAKQQQQNNIQLKSVTQKEGQDYQDLYGRKFPKYTPKVQDEDLEESDGYRDFDIDANAIYQHQFAQKNYSHKINTQEESQYSDEQEEELDEYGEGEEYDEDDQEYQDGEDYEEGEEGDEYDLEEIENLKLEEQKNEKSKNSEYKQNNNFMQNYEKQLESLKEQKNIQQEQKQNSEEKLKNVKFEQTLSSKKPEIQIKSSLQQASSAIGGFVPKKNNYFDADEGLDLDDEEQNTEENFQIDFSDVKNHNDEDENDYEDEEDLYQQVKNKLNNIKQKEAQKTTTDKKPNPQIKQNEMPQNQKIQQPKQAYVNYDQAVDLDDDFDDQDYPENEENDEDEEGEEEENQEEGDEYEYDLDDLDDQYQVQASQKYTSAAAQIYVKGQKGNKVEENTQGKNRTDTQKSLFDELENELEENLEHLVDYDHLDLNKLNTKELEEHKKKMDKKYEQNRKKPGDSDFIYDVRQNFDPAESNQWDVSQSQDKRDTEEVDYDIV